MGINSGYTGQAVLMGLFYNAALLLALSAIYEVTSAIPSKIRRAQPIINGVLISLISIAIMSFPFRLQTGVIFDTRSILLSVTALIFGPVPIMFAAFAASLYRLMVGGAGSLPGIAVIMVSALIGLAWRRWLYPKSAKWRWLSIYIMSICVHEVMLVCMLLLPYPDSLNVIREIAVPVMVIYPIASVLLSLLLIRQQDNRRMHGQLKQAEEKYRKITENMSDVIWTADISLRMTYVSPSIETLVGEPVQAYLNRTPEGKFSPESLKKIQALLTEEIGNEKDPLCDKYRTRIVELEHYHADGTLLWLSVNISILRDDKGNAIGFQGISRNITDRKRSEQSEREALLRLRSLIDSSPSLIMMIDESGRFVEVSSVAEQIIGLPKEELINKNVDEFAPPEISKKAHHILSKSPDNNQYLENLDVFEFDGSKRYFESSLFPINVADNKEKLCVYLGIDVTDRVTAEHALKEIENKYSSYIKSSPFGVFIVNEDGQYVEVNPCACEITGYSEDRLLKMSIRDITAEDSLESAMLHFEQLKRTGRMSAELQYIHDNGLPRWWTIDAVKLSEHRYLGFSGDITQRKATEANLQYLANQDTLTGLYNRRFYEEELKRADDSGQLPLSIIFADINGLKLINDSFGHTEGDRIIIEAARLLKENCRDDDVLARTGGDDFSIILPGTDIQSARGVFGAIQDACERYNASISNQAYHINLSLGYDTKETTNDDITQICKRAEDNMNQRKLLEKYSSYSAIISSIRATMMEKSHETEEHAERIAQLTRRLGLHLNLSVIELDHLELLATLHDIGKVGIAENILNKQDKLDEDEWNEMKKHPEIGYRIAMSSPSLAPIAKYILHHHERWDGHGYPHNLKELDVPLLSRILSIADAYDAMTQDRIYRKAITHQEAIEEIRRCSGTQFDPQIAQVFISTVMGK